MERAPKEVKRVRRGGWKVYGGLLGGMEDDKPTKKMPWQDATKKEKERRDNEDGDVYTFSDTEQDGGDGGDGVDGGDGGDGGDGATPSPTRSYQGEYQHFLDTRGAGPSQPGPSQPGPSQPQTLPPLPKEFRKDEILAIAEVVRKHQIPRPPYGKGKGTWGMAYWNRLAMDGLVPACLYRRATTGDIPRWLNRNWPEMERVLEVELTEQHQNRVTTPDLVRAFSDLVDHGDDVESLTLVLSSSSDSSD